jgi:hypothetical protein
MIDEEDKFEENFEEPQIIEKKKKNYFEEPQIIEKHEKVDKKSKDKSRRKINKDLFK